MITLEFPSLSPILALEAGAAFATSRKKDKWQQQMNHDYHIFISISKAFPLHFQAQALQFC